jgi:AAA+ ATPase superfamily predicted ATPase
MKSKHLFVSLLLVITAFFLLLACAADNTKQLLAESYQKMTNDDLLRYYYRLNDEIESQEKQSGPQVGIGIGGFGRHTGGGVGVSSGGTGYTATELRERRIDVRMELKKRGLTP